MECIRYRYDRGSYKRITDRRVRGIDPNALDRSSYATTAWRLVRLACVRILCRTKLCLYIPRPAGISSARSFLWMTAQSVNQLAKRATKSLGTIFLKTRRRQFSNLLRSPFLCINIVLIFQNVGTASSRKQMLYNVVRSRDLSRPWRPW